MKYLPIACLAVGLLIDPTAGAAQSLRRDNGPAEVPPASFAGSQYVDSKGCVYIRAGVDGNTTWVPRVSRDRKVVCGYQPSQVPASAAPATRPASTGAVTITAAVPENGAPAAAPAPAAAAPAPLRVPQAQQARAQSQSAQVPARVPAQPASQPVRYAARPATEQRPVLPAAITPAPRPQVVQAAPSGATACPNLSPVAQRYIRPGPYEINCGPSSYAPPQMQTTSYERKPSGRVVAHVPAQVVTPGQVSGQTRVVPKHVYENRYMAQGAQEPQVPAGYQRVFDDGRLNPHRAEQTFDGKARMELIWTNTVPRRLVEVQTGRDVTDLYPQMKPGQTGVVPMISSQTRVAAAASSADRVAPYRYVQVASFAKAGNAASAAGSLGAYGARVVRSGGYDVVLLGPFGSEADMAHALSAARRAGFDDAFPRN